VILFVLASVYACIAGCIQPNPNSADTWNQSEKIVLPPDVVENLEVHLQDR
jgi:hypothetical protein